MGYRIGIDAGSKTIKVVILDNENSIIHAVYRRHRADIKTTLREVVGEIAWRIGDVEGSVAITGSAGMGLAEALGMPFVQEVVATTRAVRLRHPEASAVIELGGEDAKVIYLTEPIEQRMNATCAGGTGGFIDTIAYMMGVSAKDMSDLGMGAKCTYPIASRCAVFAQTDVRPLLNAGVRKADIAGSVLDAVVRQTLGGLACGRPIEGTVVFLGGPIEHIPDLVRRFQLALGLDRKTGIKPQGAHLYTAMGAAIAGGLEKSACVMSLVDIVEAVGRAQIENDLPRLAPLFASDAERDSFRARHSSCSVPRVRLFDCEGSLYLGIDAGSTDVKLAVVDERGRLAHCDCRATGGDVLKTTAQMIKHFYQNLPRSYNGEPFCNIAHATVTGYGEDLLRAALSIDSGVVETVAHAKAATHVCPDATFLLDIGGQDMKALWLENGQVVDAVLNEACSSGCGSFISGTAHGLKTSLGDFSEAALSAESPLDLGTKCTVFMNSRVKHAQKVGASLADIAAGIAYSVVRNALFRVIGVDDPAALGPRVVVQGGAFMSDAVLRAFELISGVEAIRPDKANLMGALGAALVARDRACETQASLVTLEGGEALNGQSGRFGMGNVGCHDDRSAIVVAGLTPDVRSSLISREGIESLNPGRAVRRCEGCSNVCVVSAMTFEDGSCFISGNRCDRAYAFFEGAKKLGSHVNPPNAIALKQKLLARYGSRCCDGPRGEVVIGLIGTLHAYDQVPFWLTLFSSLGFSVLVPPSGLSSADISHMGLDTIPSESVCYPAKLSHMRAHALVDAGANALFMPRYERGMRCAVACEYADALSGNIPKIEKRGVSMLSPMLHSRSVFAFEDEGTDRETLLALLGEVAPGESPLRIDEFASAVSAAVAEQRAFDKLLERGNERALEWARMPGHRGVVLTGRSYHADPAVLHSIDCELARLGYAVLAASGFDRLRGCSETPNDAGGFGKDSRRWNPAVLTLRIARTVAADEDLDLVCLQSFGCGMDAVGMPEVREIIRGAGKPFTAIKVDDVVDVAHVRIRLRTHAETAARHASMMSEDGRAALRRGRHCSHHATSLQKNPIPDCLLEFACAGSVRAFESLSQDDVDVARAYAQDLCFVATALAGRAIRLFSADRTLSGLAVPEVCRNCLLLSLPDIVRRACGDSPAFEWLRSWPLPEATALDGVIPESCDAGRLVGIVGAAPLVFDGFLNDRIVEIIEGHGCVPVLPRVERMLVDDVRYLDQLDEFSQMGITRVIYLQSFGCLKGHVRARGALRDLRRRYPSMSITVIDYDSEASALNRENRLRLVLSAEGDA